MQYNNFLHVGRCPFLSPQRSAPSECFAVGQWHKWLKHVFIYQRPNWWASVYSDAKGKIVFIQRSHVFFSSVMHWKCLNMVPKYKDTIKHTFTHAHSNLPYWDFWCVICPFHMCCSLQNISLRCCSLSLTARNYISMLQEVNPHCQPNIKANQKLLNRLIKNKMEALSHWHRQQGKKSVTDPFKDHLSSCV